jgi:hypothetical protein
MTNSAMAVEIEEGYVHVSINIDSRSGHAKKLCKAFAEGIPLSGRDTCKLRADTEHNMSGFDAALLWGFTSPCQKVIQSCVEAGKPWVYLDLAYWSRHDHFKVTLNNRHPAGYLMDRAMPDDRFKRLKLTVEPWRKGGTYVLVAGMSGKAAWSWGQGPQEYDRNIVTQLRKVTKRPIVYRPKPSYREAKPIAGSTFDRSQEPGHYDKLVAEAWCVVTHHSNVGVDALLAGVPVFTRYGAAMHLALADSAIESRLEDPWYPDGREQWAANLAYCQWTVAEMADGSCWRHMKGLMG